MYQNVINSSIKDCQHHVYKIQFFQIQSLLSGMNEMSYFFKAKEFRTVVLFKPCYLQYEYILDNFIILSLNKFFEIS